MGLPVTLGASTVSERRMKAVSRVSFGSTVGVFALGAAAFGCASPVAGADGLDAEAAAPATAVVVVERTSGPADGTRAEAVARFVQMRSGAVDEQALRLVGAVIDFPPLGACATPGAGRSNGAARAVRLADVGTVTLESNGVRTNLVPRQVPDVADLVNGVVYTARGEAALGPRATYSLRATGTADLEPFEVLATSPAEPTDVRISPQDGALDVIWDAGSADDVVYIDIASSTNAPRDTNAGAGTGLTRCLFADGGHATIPASAIAVHAGADAGTVTLHRLHRDSFHVRGLDGGEVRFDFARILPFSFASLSQK
jgi:hypothetical protein